MNKIQEEELKKTLKEIPALSDIHTFYKDNQKSLAESEKELLYMAICDVFREGKN